MATFIKKNGKYYRNNSDGTQTEVTQKDGYLHWTQSDGTQMKAKIKETPKKSSTQKKEVKKEESWWNKLKKGFVNATIGASVAEAPAVQTANGWYMDNNGDWKQDPDRPGAKQLQKNLAGIGATGAILYTGGAALSYTPAIAPEITIGQIPWWSKAIGTAAGSMATGMTADEISKATTGRTIGGNIRESVKQTGGFGEALADNIPEPVWDFANPFYLTTPQQYGERAVQLYNYGAKKITPYIISRQINNAKPILLKNFEIDPTKIRVKIGDVEINDPNLNYRQGKAPMVQDFVNSGKVRVNYNKKAQEARTKKPGKFLLLKSFENPMFKQGGLWYNSGLVEAPSEIPSRSNLLVTREPLAFSNKGGHFAKEDLGGRRIPFDENQLNKVNTTAYIYEPGYGFKKIKPSDNRVIIHNITERPSKLTQEELSGIPKGERNNISTPLKDFGTYEVREWGDYSSSLGKHIGDGDEAAVFDAGNRVFKILYDPIQGLSKEALKTSKLVNEEFNPSLISDIFKYHINPKNQHQIFEPIQFEGVIRDNYGRMAPVISQRKLQPVADINGGTLTEELQNNLTQELKETLVNQGYIPVQNVRDYGYTQDGFANDYGTIFDLHPWNLGRDQNGNLKVFDMMVNPEKVTSSFNPKKTRLGAKVSDVEPDQIIDVPNLYPEEEIAINNYAQNFYTNITKPRFESTAGITLPEELFDNGVFPNEPIMIVDGLRNMPINGKYLDGFHDYGSGSNAIDSYNPIMWNRTGVHEGVSHATDEFVPNDQIEFYKEALDDLEMAAINSRYWDDYLGYYFDERYSPSDAKLWEELRSTKNEILQRLEENGKTIDEIDDHQLVRMLSDNGGYGSIYSDLIEYSQFNEPKIFNSKFGPVKSYSNNNFLNKLRVMIKYLPVVGGAVVTGNQIANNKQGGTLISKAKSGIHIKKKNRGKFTEYCGGKVTDECIQKAKRSGNTKLMKRATFAENARKWNK